MNLPPIQIPGDKLSNAIRTLAARFEPKSLRTYTPTHAVFAGSYGVFHWTPEARRLYDFASGVLVANLGHNPPSWLHRVFELMDWRGNSEPAPLPLTSYNAVTEIEAEASRRLITLLQSQPGGRRFEQAMWAASGSEAVQKALWAALARDPKRDIILATRHGFHGKKGLAGATTGCETDKERDPRVRFISFPMEECVDVSLRDKAFDPLPYQRELEKLYDEFGSRITCLITEPYLGGAGSYHPPKEYLQLLQSFCRAHDIVLILDEVQSNFGRTGKLFAFETYELEPDMVILGKGLGNGAPVAAAVGPAKLFDCLDYGEASDTYSGNPFVCAAILATLECYDTTLNLSGGRQPSEDAQALRGLTPTAQVLANVGLVSPIIEAGLVKLKELPFVKHVRGENLGMVWGVEMNDYAGKSAAEWANAVVLVCYLGEPRVSAPAGNDGIHLLGPLAKKVLRIAPPLVITADQARTAMDLMHRILKRLAS